MQADSFLFHLRCKLVLPANIILKPLGLTDIPNVLPTMINLAFERRVILAILLPLLVFKVSNFV